MIRLVNVDQTQNHWWWRPGFRPGRRHYTWHLTFDGQRALHHLVSSYQSVLTDLGGLDLIPTPWLHLTMQGVGFTDEVSKDDADTVTAAVSHHLASLVPLTLTFHRPVVIKEAVVLPPTPKEPVEAVRAAVRRGIADAWGDDRVPDKADGFRPHVSIAYSNSEGPSAPILEALDQVQSDPVTITVPEASFIVLERDDHLYRWEKYANARIGTP